MARGAARDRCRQGRGHARDAAARAEHLRQTAAAKGGELRSSAADRSAEIRQKMGKMDVPWARCMPARMVRETILQVGLAPLMGLYTRLRVFGAERFDDVPPPVILVANHSSHLDTPTILRALPLQWRQRTAVAAAADYFYKKRAVANAVALIFNTVPIMRRGGGGVGSGAFDHVDRLIQRRWNLVIFPEGTRSREGELGRLRSGAAVIAQQHGIPIVPIRIRGTHDAMPPGRNWPKRVRGFLSRRHTVEVHFGAPITVGPDEDPSEAMLRVRRHLEGDERVREQVPQPADAPVEATNGHAPAPSVGRFEAVRTTAERERTSPAA
ncbi:MAG: 1-acyl-sn-glycerol-3-phosphate acyltransferase [Solirubrobacterales bacterium]|nr:1-acyl-sn-glycerol-3-phosphate acyltransferase [Solirubrobacterales bacterium]